MLAGCSILLVEVELQAQFEMNSKLNVLLRIWILQKLTRRRAAN